VGLTNNAEMDVPTSPDTVGWYKHGVMPGEQGSAVLAGHLDTMWGGPAVFWKLDDLKTGDMIDIQTADNQTLQFRVTGLQRYPVDKAPMEQIFASASGSQLNLITCAGSWKRKKGYAERLVVFAERASARELYRGTNE